MSTTTLTRKAPRATSTFTGVVVSAGKMDKTVKVRLTDTVFNKRVQKLFATHKDHLVHDPSSAARLGDVVTIQSGYRASTQVRHLLRAILSPVGDSIDDRPAIPTMQDLLRLRKEERTRRDGKLLGVADAVHRVRALEAGETEGLDEKAVQDELRHLKDRKDVQDGVRKGLNGALKRLQEAGKARWRDARRNLRLENSEGLRAELRAEAELWERRSSDWFAEAHSAEGRGRGKWLRQELEWRGLFSAGIAVELRRRGAEIGAYLAQIGAFSATNDVTAEEALRKAQDQLIDSLCEGLVQPRGVYRAEVENLKVEGNWLYSLEWLQDPVHPWRWQSHSIQLKESGRLTKDQIRGIIYNEKGRNGPIWYAALQEGLKLNPDFHGEVERLLSQAMEARRKLLEEFEASERLTAEQLKEHLEMLRAGRHLKNKSSSSEQEDLPASGREREGSTNNKKALRNAKKATDFINKASENEADAEKVQR